MGPRTVLITAAETHYFEFASGAIASVRDKPQGRQVAIAFFDLGCTEVQRDSLRPNVDFLVEPQWEFEFAGRETKPGYLRGLLARPFLRRYFPGFEIYLWLDADAWLQDWSAIDLLCEGARRRRGLAIVPEIDRCSTRQYGGLPEYWKLAENWYTAPFGSEIARKLCSFPMLNAGVFALDHAAPHWKAWEDSIATALQSGCTVMTDQLALNHAVYSSGLFQSTEMLPAWCNWVCHNGFPLWDETRRCLVEPFLPHTPIGVMHLTTRDKSPVRRLATTHRKPIEMRITYPAAPTGA